MTRAHSERAICAAALAALFAATLAGCGQRGPLVLPGAQPVQQLEPPPTDEPESQEDERENEP